MRTEIRIGLVPGPLIKDLSQRWGLTAAGREIPFQYEHQHHLTLGCEVCDVLGDDCPTLKSSSRCDDGIVAGLETDFSDMDRVVAILLAQQRSYGWWEHFVDQKGSHAKSAPL
jgi:hypothetical protein